MSFPAGNGKLSCTARSLPVVWLIKSKSKRSGHGKKRTMGQEFLDQNKLTGESMKIKETTKQVIDTGKRVVTNGEQFIQAVALLVVAGFSYWALSQVEIAKAAYWVILVSLVVIGLRGMVEFVKFLDKQ